jgi:hypothetical protein
VARMSFGMMHSSFAGTNNAQQRCAVSLLII